MWAFPEMKKAPVRGLEEIYTFLILRIFVFAQESVIKSLDRELNNVVVRVYDKHETCKVVNPIVEVRWPAVVLVEAEIVLRVYDVIVDLLVADGNDKRNSVLVMRNGQGVFVHFVVSEVGIDEIVDSRGYGEECVFAVLAVIVVIVFLICNSGVRAPAPACAAFAVAGVSVGSDVPGFLQIQVDFAKAFDVVFVPVVQV